MRKPISKKLRFEVFKRDGFHCQYCGAHPPQAVLHVDHIIPVAEGGDNAITNLVTACSICNLGKGAVSLGAIPTSLKARAEEVAEREEQIRGYAEVMAQHRERVESHCWDVADIYIAHFGLDTISKADMQSIRQFVERLGVHECIRAMEIATARMPWNQGKCFRYFCGVCWNIIKEPR